MTHLCAAGDMQATRPWAPACRESPALGAGSTTWRLTQTSCMGLCRWVLSGQGCFLSAVERSC